MDEDYELANSDLIQKIIADVSTARDNGTKLIDAENLINYLDSMEKEGIQDHDIQMEHLKASNQMTLETIRLNHAAEMETFRSVMAVGASATKAFMLMNGGAAIALLAFLGNIWTKDSTPGVKAAIASSLLIFCYGVLSSGICSAVTYLSQFCAGSSALGTKKRWMNAFYITNAIAILAGLTSLILFAYGAFATYDSMGNQFG